MKTTIKLLALLTAVFALVACNKEKEDVTPITPIHERDITYTVDSTTTTVHLTTEAEFDDLLDLFCDYAEDGSEVSFHNANISNAKGPSDKESVSYSTADREAMKRWMRARESEGMTVTVKYDNKTGEYVGNAYKTAPQPQWVDLGLPSGLLWARCNVGALSPKGFGDYFAWGETETKSEYLWSNYRYGIDYCHLTKYCNDASFGDNGFTDTLTILKPGDDAATANKNNARTPTESEWYELLNYCTGEWTTIDGVNGYRFTGPNGNSIFLPATGGKGWNTGEGGHYWSASVYQSYPFTATDFKFYHFSDTTEVGAYMGYDDRAEGFSIRAVRDAE